MQAGSNSNECVTAKENASRKCKRYHDDMNECSAISEWEETEREWRYMA